jgi:methylated-DNA-[protein]-cysteine S-methyltransferase
MNTNRAGCNALEDDVIAVATGEAIGDEDTRVRAHTATCESCRLALDRYRRIDAATRSMRHAALPSMNGARERLDARLADLRNRALTYGIFPSPLGDLLIARSERGVSLVEYLNGDGDAARSRLHGRGIDAREDSESVASLYRELMEFLEGRRTHLDWALDMRLARSDFHRAVLQETVSIPYGAVASYAGIACNVGKPAASRAVAQALRWNPLPIVVPCHRVIGTSGALVGYAGNHVDLKQRLLEMEGVHVCRAGGDFRIRRDAGYVSCPGDGAYCLPTCPSLTKMDHPHRLLFFGSRQRAEAAGLSPCDTCHPELHALPE